MQTLSFNVPNTVRVTTQFGTHPLGEDRDFFIVAEDLPACHGLVERFIATSVGALAPNKIRDADLRGARELRDEIARAQRILGSITITGAVEIYNQSGFHSLYVVAKEDDKERIYFEEAQRDENGVPLIANEHYKVIVKALHKLF